VIGETQAIGAGVAETVDRAGFLLNRRHVQGEDWCSVDDLALLIPEVQGEASIPPSPLG
jgi:hypothetical protein